jgi:hypothetical protein
MKMNQTRMGEISFTKRSNIITADIRMKPIFFITFSQAVTTRLDTKGFPVQETLNTTVNKRKTLEYIDFQENKVIHTVIAEKKSQVKSYPTQTQVHSVNSLINLFLMNKILENSRYPLFMVDKIVSIVFTKQQDKDISLISTDERYNMVLASLSEAGIHTPRKVRIKRYMLYGINWHIFTLHLREKEVHSP